MLLMMVFGIAVLSAWLIYAKLPGWANALVNALAGLILVVAFLAATPRDPFGED